MPYLPEAVTSILSQSMGDFELVIVDDASTDATPQYLIEGGHSTLWKRDSRVRVLRNKTNLGVAESLNRGLDACHGEYIARMDADDIAEPDRLSTQLEFLESHPDIGIVGSSRLLIDESGRPIRNAPAMSDDLSIRWKCLLGNPLPHPTVMFRRKILEQHSLRYDAAFRSAQDYELWTRLLQVTRAANISRPLLRYRVSPSSISQLRKAEQIANHDRIALLANQRLLPSFPLGAEQTQNLRARYGGASVRNPELSQSDPQWIDLLYLMLNAFAELHQSAPGIEQCVARQGEWIEEFRSDMSISGHWCGMSTTTNRFRPSW
jgi:glycosyltransferase involved in cell wall biosynthesis